MQQVSCLQLVLLWDRAGGGNVLHVASRFCVKLLDHIRVQAHIFLVPEHIVVSQEPAEDGRWDKCVYSCFL